MLSAKSELAVAIRYATTRWPALTRYRDDGNLEIDNNIAERALRVVALGRKKYLFCGTAKLNGLNPEAYLRDVINRIAPRQPPRRNAALESHRSNPLITDQQKPSLAIGPRRTLTLHRR